MRQFKLSLFCLLLSFVSIAQDTLFLKDKQKLIVVVKEVGQTEIQYKKADLPDGPMYITSKNDIEKIIYKNGYTEVIKSSPSTPPAQDFVVYSNDMANINTEKLVYDDTKRRHSYLLSLIERHPNPTRKPALMSNFRSMKGLKAGRDATRTVAIVFGGITLGTGILTGLIYSIDSYAGETIAVVPIAFGTVAAITCATAITLHVNLKKKRHAFVDLYNK